MSEIREPKRIEPSPQKEFEDANCYCEPGSIIIRKDESLMVVGYTSTRELEAKEIYLHQKEVVTKEESVIELRNEEGETIYYSISDFKRGLDSGQLTVYMENI